MEESSYLSTLPARSGAKRYGIVEDPVNPCGRLTAMLQQSRSFSPAGKNQNQSMLKTFRFWELATAGLGMALEVPACFIRTGGPKLLLCLANCLDLCLALPQSANFRGTPPYSIFFCSRKGGSVSSNYFL
jgi:hypothetical protein